MSTSSQRLCFTLILFFSLFLPLFNAYSLSPSSHTFPVAHVKLDTVDNHLALIISMKKGYKTYWLYAGHGTYPPRATLSTAPNFSKEHILPLLFPQPKRIIILDLHTLGYQNTLILPLLLPPSTPSPLTLNIDIPVCSDLQCFPLRTTLSSPPFSSLSSPPLPSPPPLNTPKLSLTPQGKNFILTASLQGSAPPPNDIIIAIPSHKNLPPFPQPSFVTTPSQHWLATSSLTLTSPPPPSLTLSLFVPPSSLPSRTDTLSATSTNLVTATPSLHTSFLITLLFAFIGGLIINIMPCVIPLIGLKFASPLTPQKKQRYFLFQSFGILTSFAVLALIFLIGFHTFNAPLWGQQLQSPPFITALAFFLSFFAFQLAGIAHFSLPASLHNRLGISLHNNALLKPFSTGILIPLIATPCTAPFIATSLTAALVAASPLHGALVFLAIGLGIATPSLLIAFFPSLTPSPSPRFARPLNLIMASLLIAFVVWLVSLTSSLHSPALTLTLSFSLFASASLFFLSRFSLPYLSKLTPYLALPILIIPPLFNSFSPPPPSPLPPFNPHLIYAALLNQQPVLVSISADWCLTCKINDTVINATSTKKWIQTHNILLIKGDWTRPHKNIENYLNHHNAYGIPFNALYIPPPSKKPLTIFPSILSTSILTSSLSSSPTSSPASP